MNIGEVSPFFLFHIVRPLSFSGMAEGKRAMCVSSGWFSVRHGDGLPGRQKQVVHCSLSF